MRSPRRWNQLMLELLQEIALEQQAAQAARLQLDRIVRDWSERHRRYCELR